MSRRRRALAASPLLIGAVTVLIVIVAVYISYNANSGLPFTPTYNINVVLPGASNLIAGNEVRISGTRVGIVERIVPQQNPRTGQLAAVATLKLEKKVQPLPADTHAVVQSVSSIGVKYLSLEEGTSKRTIPQGGTIPITQTRRPVNIGEFFNMFDKKTRLANQENLRNFGDGLAGRGTGLNETLAELKSLLTHTTPLMHELALPQTGLGGLFQALDRAAREAAPVAAAQGRLYTDLDTFFGAWAKVAPALEESIVEGPAALHQATRSLAFEAKFVNKSTEFMRLLRPGAQALRTAAPSLGEAFKLGARNLPAATALNSELASSAKAVQSFSEDPVVSLALEDLTHTATIGTPFAAALAEDQHGCNYITLAFRNVASAFSQSIGIGTIVRVLPLVAPTVANPGNNAESYPASAPANGGASPEEALANHLHYNPYPNIALCEAGNETYAPGRTVIGHVPGAKKEATEATHRKEDLFGEEYSKSILKNFPKEGAK